MRQTVKITTPEGVMEYPVYIDNRELAKDYAETVVKDGDKVMYNNRICEVLGDFVDCDGEHHVEMLEVMCLRMM
jgi:hypothetical protein